MYEIEKIREIVNQALKEHSEKEEVDYLEQTSYITISEEQDQNNLEEIGIDSLMFIEIIIRLEEELNIEIPEEYLTISKMNSIHNITNNLNNIIIV